MSLSDETERPDRHQLILLDPMEANPEGPKARIVLWMDQDPSDQYPSKRGSILTHEGVDSGLVDLIPVLSLRLEKPPFSLKIDRV
jgi:hypothetical protein